MSISDLFDSGFRKRNQSHFAAIVRVAMTDNVMHDAEKAFLDRLAISLNISEDDYKKILKNYTDYPINPPTSYNARLERLYDLARMIRADEIEGDNQVKLLEKLCVALGFTLDNVRYIADKALSLVYYGVDLAEFTEKMKSMNK